MRRPYPDGQPPAIRDFISFEEHIRLRIVIVSLGGGGAHRDYDIVLLDA